MVPSLLSDMWVICLVLLVDINQVLQCEYLLLLVFLTALVHDGFISSIQVCLLRYLRQT